MTYEEALHEISTKVYRNTDDFEMRISKQCYKAIVNALEKQIPKKPLKTGEEYINGRWVVEWECAACGNPYIDDSFCRCCGQALDWGGSE